MRKPAFRSHFLDRRHVLSHARRQAARIHLLRYLYPSLSSFHYILSFISTGEEIDLSLLNAQLAREGRLALFYCFREEKRLIPYLVDDPEKQLQSHSQWQILQPIPHRCSPLALDHIGAILVPGLCFDLHYHRIGYGQGYYDRFLRSCSAPPRYGIAFHEQLSLCRIPVDSHDQALSNLFFF